MKQLLELVYSDRAMFGDNVRAAFSDALRNRYPRMVDLTDRKNEERRFQLRVNGDVSEGAVPYAGLIPPDQELSGGYGGMSFVIFPSDTAGSPALLAMVVGTNGLAPDEALLGRPGHARRCSAISAWVASRARDGFAWSKRDPVRIDLSLPMAAENRLESWRAACRKYGNVLYSVFAPPNTRSSDGDEIVLDALKAFVDLFFEERRIAPKADQIEDRDRIRRASISWALPTADDAAVATLLADRRFVVIEGPPGTGKTTMADRLLETTYDGNGRLIQFHPGTTYESFVGGLAPVTDAKGGALSFRATPGHLMEASVEASKNPSKPYLLVIDEINRADLAKVLGEAIYLLEPSEPQRSVKLQYEYDKVGRSLALPSNLHVLGTMNSADRSIAILDVAVRRRFAFVSLWPQLSVVEERAGERLQTAFEQLLTIFIEHASDDALPLMPGHSYFFGTDAQASTLLRTGLRPLLEEYLAQGYVAGFADEVRAYLDSIVQQA